MGKNLMFGGGFPFGDFEDDFPQRGGGRQPQKKSR